MKKLITGHTDSQTFFTLFITEPQLIFTLIESHQLQSSYNCFQSCQACENGMAVKGVKEKQ